MKKLAIYDMDRTITRRATFTPFLIFAALRLNPLRLLLLPLFLTALLGYPLGLVDRKTLKQIGFRLMLGRTIDRARLDDVANAFAARTLERNVYPAARAQIAADRADGCTLVMATASPDFYARHIGDMLGFEVTIATRQTQSGASWSHLIDGPNCYGASKLDYVTAWFIGQNVQREKADIRFYSDHPSDAPVFEWADKAIATNPNRKLRMMAQLKGWDILDCKVSAA